VEQKHYILCHHLVAFLDVLGQRERFRQLRLPETPDEEMQAKEVIKNTAGYVLGLRKLFQTQFEVFEKGAQMGAFTKEPVHPSFVGFSDSFVTSVPLRDDGTGLARVATVFSALSSAAVVMIHSLAAKHALRGGIDVGLATEIGPGEIYGTALERAYVLESEVADYPRIVIGDELWKYLNSVLAEFDKSTRPMAKAVTAIVGAIQRMITTDRDGKRILDYLGEFVFQNSVPAHVDDAVRPAYEFVLSEQKRLMAEGNAKLIERYASLRSYFESRLPLWSVPVIKD